MSAPPPRRRERGPRRRKPGPARPLPPLWPVLLGLLAVGLVIIVLVDRIAAHQKRLIEQMERDDSIRAAGTSRQDGAPGGRPRPIDSH